MLRRLRHARPTVVEESGAGHDPDAVLEFRHVWRTFTGPPEVTALRDCSAAIYPGDLATVCGPSGSGKSTWMSLAGMLDRPTRGSIHLRGIDTAHLRESERTGIRGQWLGLVFQSFHLMPHKTVTQNIELAQLYTGGRKAVRTARARELAERVGLGPRADALAKNLSGGEMQRTAIARALMNDPAILLCDEPTGNLDSQNSLQVMELLQQLNHDGTSIVIITHDPGIAASGSRRFEVKDGVMRELP